MTLGLLSAGSLYTVVFDRTEGKYMVYVSGYVPRKEVLELKSVFDLVVGDSEGEVGAVQDDEAQLRIDTIARMAIKARRASPNLQTRQALQAREALQGLSENTEQ